MGTKPAVITDAMVELAARAYVRAVQETFKDFEPIDYRSADWQQFEDTGWQDLRRPIRAALEAVM